MLYDKDLTKEQMKNHYSIRYDKVFVYLKKEFEQDGFKNALKAMDRASKYHCGLRKNNAPEFSHQIEICLFLTTIPQLPAKEFLDDFYTAALLHDIIEDYNLSYELIENEYSPYVANLVSLLSKVENGIKKTNDEYFAGLSTNIHAILIKLADRFHNLSTMHNGFTIEKQKQYINEVKEYFYPLVKGALANYPNYNKSLYLMKNNIEVLYHTIQSSINNYEKMENKYKKQLIETNQY